MRELKISERAVEAAMRVFQDPRKNSGELMLAILSAAAPLIVADELRWWSHYWMKSYPYLAMALYGRASALNYIEENIER